MSLPPIPAPVSTVIPAVEEKTYDKYRLLELRIDANNPNDPVVAIARLQKGRVTPQGSWELSPLDNPVYFRFDNVLAKAAQDQELFQVVSSILVYFANLVTTELTPQPPPPDPPSPIEPEPEPQ